MHICPFKCRKVPVEGVRLRDECRREGGMKKRGGGGRRVKERGNRWHKSLGMFTLC